MADSQLQDLTRRIPLVAYAASAGYVPSVRERAAGLTFLEHPVTRDAIAVGRTEDGVWMYASLAECRPRPAHESPKDGRQRLREGIACTRDKGTIIEFEQHRLRIESHVECSREAVAARLRAWLETSLETRPRGVHSSSSGSRAEHKPVAADATLEPLHPHRHEGFPSLPADQEALVRGRAVRSERAMFPLGDGARPRHRGREPGR